MIFLSIKENGTCLEVLESSVWELKDNGDKMPELIVYNGGKAIKRWEVTKNSAERFTAYFRGNTKVETIFYIEKKKEIKVERNT